MTRDSEDIALVRRALTAFLRGDVAAAFAVAGPDMVSVRVAPLPDPQTYHGRDGLQQMWDDWTAPFERFEMSIGQFAETGGRVIVDVFQRGTGQSSGVEVEGRFWLTFELAAGEVVRMHVFASERQALEAVSAAESASVAPAAAGRPPRRPAPRDASPGESRR